MGIVELTIQEEPAPFKGGLQGAGATGAAMGLGTPMTGELIMRDRVLE